MAEWVEAAELDSFQRVTRVEIKGYELALFKSDDKVYAIDDICSHEYSRLSEGMVWDGKVYCAKHGSAFNLETGAVGSLPATEPVSTYPVKVAEGTIFVELE